MADYRYLHPAQRARKRIDEMLERAGWVVQDYKSINLYAGTGVAVRELATTAGAADYVLFVDRQAVGVTEAKKKGIVLSGVEWQTIKYQTHVPDELPALLVDDHLPYGYESTGDETWFTCRFDPEPTTRRVFWFHRPETLAEEIAEWVHHRTGSLRARIPDLPPLDDDPYWLRDAQAVAPPELRGFAQGQPLPGVDPDGDRFGVPIAYFFLPPPRLGSELVDTYRPTSDVYVSLLAQDWQLDDLDDRLRALKLTSPEDVTDLQAALYSEREHPHNWHQHFRTWRRRRLAALAVDRSDRLDEVAEFLVEIGTKVREFGPKGYFLSHSYEEGDDPTTGMAGDEEA